MADITSQTLDDETARRESVARLMILLVVHCIIFYVNAHVGYLIDICSQMYVGVN